MREAGQADVPELAGLMRAFYAESGLAFDFVTVTDRNGKRYAMGRDFDCEEDFIKESLEDTK